MTYFHACCFSPNKTTFLQAVKNGNFVTWPQLTYKNVKKYLQETPATAKGHLNQERKNLQSTKKVQQTEDFFPKPESSPPTRTNNVLATIVNFQEENKAYSDLTGRLPEIFSRGNAYILVIYDYDSNAILAEPLRSRAAAVIRDAWEKLNHILMNKGRKPELYVLDNECSTELKAAMSKYTINFQRVPPHVHRRNAAERAIQTFKNHFVAGLATAHPDFPASECDRLIPQAVLTLNHLRNARANPNLSAHAFLHGTFNFAHTPLAPPATKVVVHVKPKERNSWDQHGRDGWYIGPALEHYRCVRVYIPTTRAEVDSDTVQFFQHDTPLPQTTTADFLKQAAADIVALLKNRQEFLPNLQAGDETLQALQQVAELLNRADEPPHHTPPTTPPEPTSQSPLLPPTLAPETRVEPSSTSPQPTPASLPRVETQINATSHQLMQNLKNIGKHPNPTPSPHIRFTIVSANAVPSSKTTKPKPAATWPSMPALLTISIPPRENVKQLIHSFEALLKTPGSKL